jgi:hypothetical protein
MGLLKNILSTDALSFFHVSGFFTLKYNHNYTSHYCNMKNAKLVLFTFLCLLSFLISNAQVNLQKGAAEVSIPLYSFSDPNNSLTTSIDLSYIHGNGLPVSSVASPVGTGWSLNCGGFIERIQRGEPDDQKNNDTYTYPNLPHSDENSAFWVWARDYFPNGYLYADYSTDMQVSNEAAHTPCYDYPYKYYKPRQKYLVDREQDMFRFNFHGREGFFLISKKDANQVNVIRTLTDSKLKIEKVDGDLNNTQNIRTTISQFKITDENGVEYIFGVADLDEVCDYETGLEYNTNGQSPVPVYNTRSTYINNQNIRVNKAVPRNSFIKNRWYLSQVKNSLTGAKIDFIYEQYDVDFLGKKILQRTIKLNDASAVDRVGFTHIRPKGIANRLKRIVVSNRDYVEFGYSAEGRIDAGYDKSLSSIGIVHDNQAAYYWNFEYGYFVKTAIKAPTDNFSDEDKAWARLCLLKLKRTSGLMNTAPYVFDYYRGNENGMNSAVPPMFSAQQDLGGYYCTQHLGFLNPADNTVSTSNPPYEPYGDRVLPKTFFRNILQGLAYDPAQTYEGAMSPTLEARNGLIKSVQYPQGGRLEYEYEQNQIGSLAQPKMYYGVRVNKTILHDGVTNKPIVKDFKYISQNGNSSGWGYEALQNTQTITSTVYDCGSERPLMNLHPVAENIGTYVIKPLFTTGSFTASTSLFGTTVPQFSILYFSNIIIAILDGWFGNSGGDTHSEDIDFSFTTSVGLTSGNALPFQYARVEQIDKMDVGTNGKTVYEFTSPSTGTAYGIDHPVIASPYTGKQRFAYWFYGLPEKISVFDKNDNPVSKIENLYNPVKYTANNFEYQSQKYNIIKPVYRCGFNAPAEEKEAYDRISSEIYYPMFGRMELAKTKQFTYNGAVEIKISESDYTYSPNNYLPNNISTVNSKNELVESHTYYPEDYSLGGAIQQMKSHNIVNAPVETRSVITKNGSRYVKDGTVIEYGILGNGNIRPVKTHLFNAVDPVPENQVLFSATQLIPSSVIYKEEQQVSYNAMGAAEGVTGNGRKNGSLYGYDNKSVVAEIVNATGNETLFESFEETGEWIGLEYDNTKRRSGNYSAKYTNLTYNRVEHFSNKVINLSLTADTKYKVSGWAYQERNSGVTLNISMQSASGASTGNYMPFISPLVKENWVFFESEFTVPANTTKILLSVFSNGADLPGSVWFDDIRILPAAASMTTYTYKVPIGVSSMTDANNRIMHYLYDALGRLYCVADDKGNILKYYCYQENGQSSTCTLPTVGNAAKTQVFKRNNCDAPSGKYGTDITYSVPANKYFGFDQQGADLLAQEDIDRFGQVYANEHGTCLQGEPSDARSGTFTKSDCPVWKNGTDVLYEVPAGKHAAATKLLANQLADNDVATNGPVYANEHGFCVFYNTAISGTYYSQNCLPSETPVAYPVTVPAKMFFSTVDQGSADAQAQNHAQLLANSNGGCTPGAQTVYVRLEVEPSYSDNTSEYDPNYDATLINYYQQVRMYLRFYSDQNCTTPHTLTSPVNFSINTHGFFETESSYQSHMNTVFVEGTAGAGTSEIFFDDILSFEGFWGMYHQENGYIFYEKWADNYTLGTVTGVGVVKLPDLVPVHTTGYN